MIHHLEGPIVEQGEDYLVVDVGGVGYRVYTSRATREAFHGRTEPVKFYTYLHLREDAVALYGFSSPEERQLFELLLSVSGIGPRLAISILSTTTPVRLQEAIMSEQVEGFSQVKGVGKKTAERLIIELRDAVAELPLGGETVPAMTQRDEVALGALTQSLGFGERESRRAIAQAREGADGDLAPEALIRRALEFLSRS